MNRHAALDYEFPLYDHNEIGTSFRSVIASALLVVLAPVPFFGMIALLAY